jgi:hypothetical protein
MSTELIQTGGEQELQQLPQMIQTWKGLHEQTIRLREELREKMKMQKVLESSILSTMTKHNIGALDLKSSGGRLLNKKKQSKGSLSQKHLQEMATTYLKSEDQANGLLAFISEKRGVKVKHVLSYENL